jgi:uncharacterized protein (DUF305 family)
MTLRPNRPSARTAALLAAVTLSLTGALAACGGDDTASTGSSSVPASKPFNDADLTFATDMIPHHAQALSMVDLTRGRPLPAPMRRLAQHILEAQGPEIQTMAGWLQDWHRPVPQTMRDHVNADDHDGMGGMGQANGTSTGSDMPGMMTAREMQDLAHASDADFPDQWLRAMVRHHEGAVQMARTEQSSGEYAGATTLARRIAAAQTREIAQMKAILSS